MLVAGLSTPDGFGHGWVGVGCHPFTNMDGCRYLGSHSSACHEKWVSGMGVGCQPTPNPNLVDFLGLRRAQLLPFTLSSGLVLGPFAFIRYFSKMSDSKLIPPTTTHNRGHCRWSLAWRPSLVPMEARAMPPAQVSCPLMAPGLAGGFQVLLCLDTPSVMFRKHCTKLI